VKTISSPAVARLLAALIIALVALARAPAAASMSVPEAPAPARRGEPSPRPGLGNRGELEAFFDGVIAAQLEAHHLPGATLSVVERGMMVFAKGYGYADIEKRIPVVAEKSLFRPASISKLFTWTAMMQLVERGKLDMNVDVNTYLGDIHIPATYAQPITLEHLATHTPGFEDRTLGVSARKERDLEPLDTYLERAMPARVFPPGEAPAYSNYGTALAGHVVARVSGEPFHRIIEERIFAPLSMRRSTFRQPAPPDLAQDIASGYTYKQGAYKRREIEWIQDAPAGALSTTATDMAAFMIAHLQLGRYGDARILEEATAEAMHRRHFTADRRLTGWTEGFMEIEKNGQRMIGHRGSLLAFNSGLLLVPDHGVGVFVSYNGAGDREGGRQAVTNLLEAFVDRFYPADAPPPAPVRPDSAERAGWVEGYYMPSRSAWTTPEKLLTLIRQISVSAKKDGTLRISRRLRTEPSQWAEIEPWVFRQVGPRVDREDVLLVHAEGRGRAARILVNNSPGTVYLKLPWYETAPFQLALLGGASILFLSALVAVPVRAWICRRRGHPAPPRGERLGRAFLVAASALNLLFLGAAAAFIASRDEELVFGLPPAAKAALVVPYVSAALTAALVVVTALAWKRRSSSLAARIHATAVTLAAVAFVGWLSDVNLLGAGL